MKWRFFNDAIEHILHDPDSTINPRAFNNSTYAVAFTERTGLTPCTWIRGNSTQELQRLLIQADQRALRIGGPGINFQHVLHPIDELRALLRRDTPLLLPPRL